MPASLRSGAEPSPGHTRSFGHFSRGAKPATGSIAAAAATATAIVARSTTGAGGRSRTDSSRPAPGGATHEPPGAAPAGRLVVGDQHDPLGLALAGQLHGVGVGRAGLVDPAHVGEPRAGPAGER